MSVIETSAARTRRAGDRLGLLHFVWQGTLVGALTALRVWRASAGERPTFAMSSPHRPVADAHAAGRHRRAVLAHRPGHDYRLKADVNADVATPPQAARGIALIVTTPIYRRGAVDLVVRSRPGGLRCEVEPWLPMLVFAWLCGVVILSLRLVSGWLWVQRMKSHGDIADRRRLGHIAVRLSRRLHIAPTRPAAEVDAG